MIWNIVNWVTKFLGSNILDRVLDTVDNKIEAENDRDRIKGEIIKEHIRHRADFLRTGGLWLFLAIGSAVFIYFAAVVLYSIFWHANGPFPQDWDIARMPQPFMEWCGWVMLGVFGVFGLNNFKK